MYRYRFKINLETNKLKPYIDVILEILKQKVNPDILVVRRYKSDDKSVPRSVVYGPLLNDKIFEPKRVDFCQVYIVRHNRNQETSYLILILIIVLKTLVCILDSR